MSDIEKQVGDFDAYFRSANGVQPNARISVPTEEWSALRAALKTLLSSAQSGEPAAPQAVHAVVPEAIEQMAVDRYKVVPSHESMFHRWAVVAGNGTQQLYIGREVECLNMARKFAGAFLDGAFVAMQNTAPAHPAEGVPAPMPVPYPHHCTARTADGFCEECEGHAQAMAEWNAERAAIAATHPTQQGMDAIAALQKVRDIAVSALLTGSLDRQDWIDDMDRIAAQAKQGGAA